MCEMPSVQAQRLSRPVPLAHRITDAVRPAAEEPLPEVYTAIGAVLDVNFRNCDLAVEGSPAGQRGQAARARLSVCGTNAGCSLHDGCSQSRLRARLGTLEGPQAHPAAAH